jgi:hypothetical protein
MADLDPDAGRKRTAILVVHGIGSQRALETVRGVIQAVWQNGDHPEDRGNRIWSHPEPGGADIDLSVMTTNGVPGSHDGRSVDFHELYWAHLMSETKAVAVLLWLYELARKGPIMTVGLNGLWWAAAIFLCLMDLSFALLVLQGIFLFSQTNPQAMLVAPFLLVLSSVTFGLLITLRYPAPRLTGLLGKISAFGLALAIAYLLVEWRWAAADVVTAVALPAMTAFLATYLLMNKQGARAFWRAIWISFMMFAVLLLSAGSGIQSRLSSKSCSTDGGPGA